MIKFELISKITIEFGILNKQVIFQKAKLQDADKIYDFETAYIREIEPENLDRWCKAAAKIRAQLEINIGKMFVAKVADDLAGHIYWDMHKNEPHIFSIYVSNPYRRMGIAKKLMGYAENEIQENGFKTCHLSTRYHNPARHLFEAIGYQQIGQENGWYHLEKLLQNE